MSKKNTLDEMENISKKIPILDKLEIDKVIAFIKLLFVDTLTAISLFVSILGGYVYFTYQTTTSFVILGFTFAIFINVLIWRTFIIIKEKQINYEKQKYEENREDRNNTLDDLRNIIKNRENLRTSWINGWRKILVETSGIYWDYLKSVLKRDIPDGIKVEIMTTMIEGLEDTRGKYETILPHIDNPYRLFTIGINEPPKTPNTAIIEEFEEMLHALDEIGSKM